jgi:hypothetical protein
MLRLDDLREHEDADVGIPLADLLRGARALVGLSGRHADVDDRDVGLLRGDGALERFGLPHARDHLDAGVSEHADNPLADQDRVVGDHDAHGSSPITRVP